MSENGFSMTGIFSYKSIIVDLRKPVFSHVLQGATFKGLKKSDKNLPLHVLHLYFRISTRNS